MYTPECKDKDRLTPRLLSFKKYSFEIVIYHANDSFGSIYSAQYHVHILQYYQHALLLGLVYMLAAQNCTEFVFVTKTPEL